MDRQKWRLEFLGRTLQAWAIVFFLGGLSLFLVWQILDWIGLLFLCGIVSWTVVQQNRLRPGVLQKVQAIRPEDIPELWYLQAGLAQKAGLSAVPVLALADSPLPNAMTLKFQGRPWVLITRGLLQILNFREVAGVLAHEIAHIHHRDLGTFAVVNVMAAVARVLGALVFFTLVLLSPWGVGWDLGWVMLASAAAPLLGLVLPFAYLRTQEYRADLMAAQLTQDPESLAGALAKISWRSSWFDWLSPRWWRSHPPTPDRIRRLKALPRAPFSLQGL